MRHTLAEAALAYAAQKWYVFPLQPRAKEPLTAHGFKDATTDATQLEQWWTETPDANVGLHPGPSGVVVVDVDGVEGRDAAIRLRLFAQPTLTAVTPRGWHLYFRHPGFPVSNKPLAPHLDVRGDEGYVVVPPSVHPSGGVYRWVKDATLDLPPDIVELLRNGAGPRAAAPLPPGAPIPEGQRNQTLASLAGTMRRRGMEAPEIAAALLAVNAARCRPPLPDDEVRAIAASIGRYRPAPPPPEPSEAGEAGPGLEQIDEPESASRSALPQSRSLAEILMDPDATKAPAPVVPSLAWAGRTTLVAAREGVGKSTLFANAAAAVTTGGEFLGERCARGTVLWVLVEEHQSDLVIRALRFQTAPDALYVLERPDEPLAALRAEVDRLRPALVIVDTLHRFASALVTDASTADQWGPLMTALDTIARRSNAAVLLSAQAIKATGEYRDSSEIGHGVDVVVNLVRPEKDQPHRRLEIQKARWTLEDVTCELVGTTYLRAGTATTTKTLSPQRQKVLSALEPPMTFTEWLDASGVPKTTFRRALRFLTDHGYVHQDDHDTYNQGPPGPSRGHGSAGPEPPEGPLRSRA